MAGSDVAYQVVGDGPRDLLFCWGLGSHVELCWDLPQFSTFLSGLASFSRVVFFDRRGTGASEGVSGDAVPTWEEWTEDLAAVLDAVGSDKTAIVANIESGPVAILYTAMHPDRVSALVLLNTTSRYSKAPDYPIGASTEEIDALVEIISKSWGTPELSRQVSPSKSDDAEFIRFASRLQRSAATPRSAAAQFDYMLRNDVREALALVQVPTLVLHVKGNALVPIEHGHYLAEHIDGAKFVQLPGSDIGPLAWTEVVAHEIAEFLTGARHVTDTDRFLTTVVFTDIVGSTTHAAELGDAKWHELLERHNALVREELNHFHGVEIGTAGDGFLATFDGPARAVRAALSICRRATTLGLEIRAGMHTGEVERSGQDIAGIAVHIGARVSSLARPGEVLVSRTVTDLVAGSGIEFEDRGEYELKGVPGRSRLFAVKS